MNVPWVDATLAGMAVAIVGLIVLIGAWISERRVRLSLSFKSRVGIGCILLAGGTALSLVSFAVLVNNMKLPNGCGAGC